MFTKNTFNENNENISAIKNNAAITSNITSSNMAINMATPPPPVPQTNTTTTTTDTTREVELRCFTNLLNNLKTIT